jgi:hypothetical protein
MPVAGQPGKNLIERAEAGWACMGQAQSSRHHHPVHGAPRIMLRGLRFESADRDRQY